ncbi:hypothetical protein [Streptomyces canus]|uniref:Integrase n=1 Tax=Streptomyces canus TaxID=58343 RepID=A0AAW8FU10_9ACTN|nr:hypothetical protein [Streptomyces canus]MDQ0757573.1 hypothetical protein [Streptomyces canus]MDQ0913516.1 hypothetical protein [Streptomyces canus]MDQ1073726.1 hypothetical protein [Streptomyces canus]
MSAEESVGLYTRLDSGLAKVYIDHLSEARRLLDRLRASFKA